MSERVLPSWPLWKHPVPVNHSAGKIEGKRGAAKVLYFLMDRISPYDYKNRVSRKLILNAWRAFERVLQGGTTFDDLIHGSPAYLVLWDALVRLRRCRFRTF
jgi:hypothetical protein